MHIFRWLQYMKMSQYLHKPEQKKKKIFARYPLVMFKGLLEIKINLKAKYV